jgi:putative intracellular protease/amidase
MADYYQRTTCRMCDSHVLERVLVLTPTPPGNNFLAPDELERPERAYPLELYQCGVCHHVQLGHVVDPRILYQNNYTYVSATGTSFVQHLRQYASDMIQWLGLGSSSLVADIGSNDGTCLRFFKEAEARVQGVDPATAIANQATRSGIPTVADFFSHRLALQLRQDQGPAALVTSHNACAHIDRLEDVFRGVEHWLAEDGVFVVEVGYFLDVYQNAWFDTIYHEHLDYHTVEPFSRLCARTGLEVLRVQRVSPQGGSIRVIMQRAGGPRRADESASDLVRLEHQHGLHLPATFAAWGHRIAGVGAELRQIVRQLKESGKTIAGYGAATKATTLLCHFGLGRRELDFIADDNPLKQGSFSPASHIPVVSPATIAERQPDYLLILAWNFAEGIMARHREYVKAGGRFILPMPTARIVAA